MTDKFKTIVADPPWEYGGFASGPGRPGKRPRGVIIEPLDYPSMTLAEICSLPVINVATEDCRLFLWTTNKYLPDAFTVLKSWGFQYRQTLVWHKTGGPSPFGGSISPNHAEYLIVGTHGSVPLLSRLKSNVIKAPRGRKHSSKPEMFFDLIESVSPAPYLELFARSNRLGWSTWGNECLNHVEVA